MLTSKESKQWGREKKGTTDKFVFRILYIVFCSKVLWKLLFKKKVFLLGCNFALITHGSLWQVNMQCLSLDFLQSRAANNGFYAGDLFVIQGSRWRVRRVHKEKGASILGFFWKLAPGMGDWCLIFKGHCKIWSQNHLHGGREGGSIAPLDPIPNWSREL